MVDAGKASADASVAIIAFRSGITEKGWPLGPLDAPSILAEAEEKAMAAVAAAPSRTELETSLAGSSQAPAAPAAAAPGVEAKAEQAPPADAVKTKKTARKLREVCHGASFAAPPCAPSAFMSMDWRL